MPVLPRVFGLKIEDHQMHDCLQEWPHSSYRNGQSLFAFFVALQRFKPDVATFSMALNLVTAAIEAMLLITYVPPYQPLTALSSSGSPPPLPQSAHKADLVRTGAYMVF